MNFHTKYLTLLLVTLLAISCREREKEPLNQTSPMVSSTDFFLPTSTTGSIIHHKYYALSYSEKDEQAEWVAYELKKDQLSHTNFKRPYFIDDPLVETESASWRNYIRSGYDRGHLCPAADRRFSKEAFDETFYTSNISPQKNDFNAGLWNRLEQKVRYWASKYDGIYVVTGGVLKGNLKSIGNENVTVPDYFYKVLLDRKDNQYKMIGFLVPHQESDKPLSDYVVSIDRIEKLTGIDFFPNLPDSIENQLERKTDYKEWSFGRISK